LVGAKNTNRSSFSVLTSKLQNAHFSRKVHYFDSSNLNGDLLAFLKFSKLENQDLKLLKKPNVVLFVQDFLVAATTKSICLT
jgi:hypothetical protein